MTYHCCSITFHNWKAYREHFDSKRVHTDCFHEESRSFWGRLWRWFS